MNECPRVQDVIRTLVAGESSPSAREALLKHAETCPDCGQVLSIHVELTRAADTAAEPSASEFAVARMNVLMGTAQRAELRGRNGFWRQAWAFLKAQPVGAAILLLALLGGAALGGRWSARPSAVGDEVLLRAIQTQAETSAGIDGFWDAPLAYSNVVARPLADDRLALSFDVSRHVDLVTPRESAVAKDVLVHAILDPSRMGAQLQAIGLTQEIMDPKLRDAVIFTLHHDPNLAVRLKAIAVLSEFPFDKTLQQAILTTLSQDVSVQIRMQALELLRARRVSPEAIRQCVLEAGPGRDDAVFWGVGDSEQQL